MNKSDFIRQLEQAKTEAQEEARRNEDAMQKELNETLVHVITELKELAECVTPYFMKFEYSTFARSLCITAGRADIIIFDGVERYEMMFCLEEGRCDFTFNQKECQSLSHQLVMIRKAAGMIDKKMEEIMAEAVAGTRKAYEKVCDNTQGTKYISDIK